MPMLWCRTDICSSKLSAKVSLSLENPFPVPAFCKLNYVSVCIINHLQIANPFQSKLCFLKVILGVLGRSVNFNITEISIKDGPCFQTIYPVFLVTMLFASIVFLMKWFYKNILMKYFMPKNQGRVKTVLHEK